MSARSASSVLNAVQTLHATVLRACASCGAPGVYHDIPDVNPGCFDPLRKGLPVGDDCPNCGASRVDARQELGEIWRRYKFPAWLRALAALAIPFSFIGSLCNRRSA